MKNPACTVLTPEEDAELMNAFPAALTEQEEDMARRAFTPIVFYESRTNGSRDCWCSSCRQRFNVPRKGHAEFFRAFHKAKRQRMKAKCPNCQTESCILAVNKFQSDFKTLRENTCAVRLTEWNGWLLVQAGTLIRGFQRNTAYQNLVPWLDVQEDLRFYETRRYAFRPGRRVEWRMMFQYKSLFDGQDRWSGVTVRDYQCGFTGEKNPVRWERTCGIGEAYPRAPYHQEAVYYIMGLENLSRSNLRYCGYLEWFQTAYGAILDTDEPRYYAWLCMYLAEFTRRPQMEFLVKLGYSEVVTDLVTRRLANTELLNWRAKNPAAFFRMSKAEFRAFRTAGCGGRDLRDYHDLRANQWVENFREYAQYRGLFGGNLHRLCEVCSTAGVPLQQGAAYVQAQAGKMNQVSARRWIAHAEPGQEKLLLREAITTWKDYLAAANRLEYDLTREDVRLPKNLAERHDAATHTIRFEEDAKEKRKYARLYKQLVKRYEYAGDGMRIVVPTCSQDIVTEGKNLCHCVGGYAPRHIQNQVTILFLRMDSAPDLAYVTIEMTVDRNPQNLKIQQIHGYKNERDGADSPRKTHAEFLDRWLAWVHAGSPRSADGTPLMPESMAVRVSA